MLKKAVSYVVLLLYLVLVAYFFSSEPERIKSLLRLDWFTLGGILLITIASYLALSIQTVYSIKPYSMEVSFSDALKLTMISIILNYLPAKPGIFAKGYFLKAVYALQVGQYLVSMLGIQILTLASACMLGVVACLVLLVFDVGTGDGELAVVMAALFLLGLIALLVLQIVANKDFRTRITRLDKILIHYRRLLSEWGSDVHSFRVGVGASTVVHVFRAIRLWLIFSALGAGLALPHVVILQSVLAAGFFLSFLPGNIGVREGIIVAFATYMGVGVETAFMASVIDRMAAVVLPLLVTPFLFRSLSERTLQAGVGRNAGTS